MGTTSEKLNYLNQTKNLIRAFLISQNVPLNTTDTFRNYAEKLQQTIKKFGTKTIKNNGTFLASKDGLDGFEQVVIDVPSSSVTIVAGSGAPTANTIRICDLVNKLVRNKEFTENDYTDANIEIMLNVLDKLVTDGEEIYIE